VDGGRAEKEGEKKRRDEKGSRFGKRKRETSKNNNIIRKLNCIIVKNKIQMTRGMRIKA